MALITKGALIAAIFLTFFTNVPLGRAATIDELRQQIDQKNDEIKKIQEELRKYNEELSKTAHTSNTLKNKITTLNTNIISLRRQITLTETQIKQKQLEIRQYDLSIKARELDMNERRQSLGQLMRSLSQGATLSMLEIVLQNNTLSDFFFFIEQTKNAERGITENLTLLRAVKKELEDDRRAAEAKRRQLAVFQGSLADKRQLTEGERKQQQELLAETKNQEKKYQELVNETEKQFQEIQREIEELENELRKQVDPSSLPPRREGFFTWPAEGILTQRYGKTAFARYSHFYEFHNGIDIAASVGTNVDAAEKGKIIAVGNSDLYCRRGAYGKFIVIDHQNNLVTLYAHLSLQKVVVGDSVERGQHIGYMGSTGRSTGPHLHFTIYDARTFELRQSKVCGILPYGGSINPLDYL